MPEKTMQKEPGKKPAPSKKPKPQQEVAQCYEAWEQAEAALAEAQEN